MKGEGPPPLPQEDHLGLTCLVIVGVTNPESRACGHEGAAQPARVGVSALCPVLGHTWGLPWSRNVTGVVFQNQPPGGARARQPCRLNWHLGTWNHYLLLLFSSPLHFKIQVPKVLGSRLDLRHLLAAPPLPPRRQVRGRRGCCLFLGLGTLTL